MLKYTHYFVGEEHFFDMLTQVLTFKCPTCESCYTASPNDEVRAVPFLDDNKVRSVRFTITCPMCRNMKLSNVITE